LWWAPPTYNMGPGVDMGTPKFYDTGPPFSWDPFVKMGTPLYG